MVCLPCSVLVGLYPILFSCHEWEHFLFFSFLLGIGIGAEYPCGSVAASEQTEEEGIEKNAQNRWFALATSKDLLLIFKVTWYAK